MGKNLDKGSYLPLGSSGTYLLEPPFEAPSFNPLEPLNEFLERRYKVILAHPERCEYFQRHPQTLKEAHLRGIGIQLNLGSLLGWFGQAPQKTAEQFMAWEIVDYLASDAHSALNRRPPNRQDWQALQRLVRPEILQKTTSINPGKLLNLPS